MKYEHYTQVGKRKPIFKTCAKWVGIIFIGLVGVNYMTTDPVAEKAEKDRNKQNAVISRAVKNAPADVFAVPILVEQKIEADRVATEAAEMHIELARANARARAKEKEDEELMISIAPYLIRLLLKDPDSAQFKGIFASQKSGLPVACGQVNARNSFGGYTGWKLFVTLPIKEMGLIDDGSRDFARQYNTLCIGGTEQPSKKAKK